MLFRTPPPSSDTESPKQEPFSQPEKQSLSQGRTWSVETTPSGEPSTTPSSSGFSLVKSLWDIVAYGFVGPDLPSSIAPPRVEHHTALSSPSFSSSSPSSPVTSPASSSSPTTAASSSFNRIMFQIEGTPLDPDIEELLQCSSSYERFNTTHNSPYFVLEDGKDYSKKTVRDWSERQKAAIEQNKLARARQSKDGQPLTPEIKRRSIYNVDCDSFTHYPNVGLIKQIMYEEGQIYWVDPINRIRLGKEGFQKPYFCPLDGYIYDLDSFEENINAQMNQQLTNKGKISFLRSPANPAITFELVELYPHKGFFAFVNKLAASVTQPLYEKKVFSLLT